MLAHIWNLADIQHRGKLNADEFAVAMHLIYQKLNGKDLPGELPENLVPPSQRQLSDLSNLAKLDAIQRQPERKISPFSSLVRFPFSTNDSNEMNPLSNLHEERRQSLLQQIEAKRMEFSTLKDNNGF
jgi:hypothetical protein